MSREYAESRIREALKQCRGNPARARQQIIAWCGEDAKLLQALAAPHLTGIVAHAVNRVAQHQEHEDEESEIPEKPVPVNMEPKTFGEAILKTMRSGNTALFGQESAAPPLRRKQASQSHIDALRRLAGKEKKD